MMLLLLLLTSLLPAMKAWLASPPPIKTSIKQLKSLDEFAIADAPTIVKVSPLWVPSELATAVTITITTQVNTSGIACCC